MKTQQYRMLCKHQCGQILYRIETTDLNSAELIAHKKHFKQTGYCPDSILEMPTELNIKKKLVDNKQTIW